MPRYDRHYFAQRHVAQETRKAARGGDFDYAMSDGRERFHSAAVVDTEIPRESGPQYAEGVPGGESQGNLRELAQVRPAGPTGREARHASERDASQAPGDGMPLSSPGRVEPPMDPRCAPQLTLLALRTLSFRLPQPVSVNQLYGTEPRSGRKYLLPEQRQFRSAVIGIVRGEMLRTEQREQPLLGKIEARVLISDRLDIDNGLKSLFDGLQHAKAMANDRQVVRLIVDRIAMPWDREYCDVLLQEIAA